MKLRAIDKEDIYVSFMVGLDLNGDPIYSDPVKTKAQVQDTSGKVVYNEYGKSEQYDLKLLLEENRINKCINSNTHFWVRSEPNNDKDNYNYKVYKTGVWQNEVLSVKLRACEQSWNSIYIHNEDTGIIRIQCFYDSAHNIVKIPKSSYINLSYSTKIWNTRPLNAQQTENLFTINDFIEDKEYKIYYIKAYQPVIVDNEEL